jgi:hypothetical protein
VDPYKVAIALSMSSNHNALLAGLSSQLLGVHTQVNKLTGGFNRLKIAIGGALAVTGGMAILKTMEALVDKTKEYSEELVKLERLGGAMGQAATSGEITKRAFDISQRVPMKVTDLMKIPGATNSLLGKDMSMALWEKMAQTSFVMGKHGSGDTGTDLNKLIRAGELSGRFTDPATGLPSQEKIEHYLDMSTKIIAATHGMVNASTLLQMSQQGGVALRSLTDEGFYTQAIMAQAMGGHRAGTAYLSLWQQMAGGTMFKRTAEGMQDVGLLGKDEWKTDHGRVILGTEASQRLTKLIGKDPLDLAANLVERFKTQGVTDPMEQMRLVMRALGRQTTQRYTAEEVANFHQMIAERERMKEGYGNKDSFGAMMNKDVAANMLAVKNAWDNLLMAVAGPQSEGVIKVLQGLTSVFNSMQTSILGMNPETITNLAMGIGILGAALVGGGAIAILAALGPVGWLVTGLLALGGALTAFGPQVLDAVKRAFDGMGAAIYSAIKHELGSVFSFFTSPSNVPGYGMGPSGAPKTNMFHPGARSAHKSNIILNMNIDGRPLAQAVGEQLDLLHEHATGAPSYDGEQRYLPADGGLMGH